MDKFVDIKIRAKYRDMLKEYCKDNGYKMYFMLRSLIEQNCRKKKVLLVDKKLRLVYNNLYLVDFFFFHLLLNRNVVRHFRFDQ